MFLWGKEFLHDCAIGEIGAGTHEDYHHLGHHCHIMFVQGVTQHFPAVIVAFDVVSIGGTYNIVCDKQV